MPRDRVNPGNPDANVRAVLFGTPQLVVDDHVVHVGARKAVALLALLLLDDAATRTQAAGLLWPNLALADARRNLRREVFRLRSLGLSIEDASVDSLALASPVQSDVAELRALAAAARTSGALPAQVTDQRAFISGVLLAGYEDLADDAWQEWLERWRARLTTKREALLRAHLRALVEREDSSAALALCRDLLAQAPCDEAVAIEAIALCRRAGDLIAAELLYEQVSAALRIELDVAPGPSLRTAIEALRRNGNPHIAKTSSAEQMSATAFVATASPYVHRSAAEAAVAAAWHAGKRVYLAGTAGIGKTRLAKECASERGAWLFVACRQGDVEVPFASAIRVLRAIIAATPDATLPAWITREVAHLLPELGTASAALTTNDARSRLQSAVVAAARILLRDNFDCVVIDDWHYGDCASLEIWDRLTSADDASDADLSSGHDQASSLARNAGSTSQTAWIVTYRSTELHNLAGMRMWQEIAKGGAVHVDLAPLSDSEFAELVDALDTSVADPNIRVRLRDVTAGNPLFIIETLRHISSEAVPVYDDGDLPLPDAVRMKILARVHALGEAARRMLEAASLLDECFEPLLLREVIGLSAGAAARALEQAETDGVVEAASDGYRFTHDLFRQCLAASLSQARRQLLHLDIAERLSMRNVLPGGVAGQFERSGELQRAIPYRIAAAEAALRVHALMDAQLHYRYALADGAEPASRVDIQLALAQLHIRADDSEAADRALDAAMQAASEVSEPRQAATLQLRAQLAMARHWITGGRTDAAEALLQAIAQRVDQAPMSLRIDARELDAHLLHANGGDAEATLSLLGQAITLCEQDADSMQRMATLLVRTAHTAAAIGATARADDALKRGIPLLEALAQPGELALALVLRAQLRAARAEHMIADSSADNVEAERDLQKARTLGMRSGHLPAIRAALAGLAALARQTGDTAAAAHWRSEDDAHFSEG